MQLTINIPDLLARAVKARLGVLGLDIDTVAIPYLEHQLLDMTYGQPLSETLVSALEVKAAEAEAARAALPAQTAGVLD